MNQESSKIIKNPNSSEQDSCLKVTPQHMQLIQI
jgi:hypothetical protein